MRAVVFNLGCKVNQYESDLLGEELIRLGYEVVYDLVEADIYIINTCAVTAEAERKSRQAVSRCLAMNYRARIFVCGCASQKSPDSFRKENVIFVTGTAKKSSILDHLTDEGFSYFCPEATEYDNGTLTVANRTRAYVKIQDGCNNFCSYCVIPYLRGRSRSKPIKDIVDEVTCLSKKTSEIVITGINTMAYGIDIGTNLTELIKALKNVDVRIRIGSFYAEGITEELLDALFSLKNFCPYFHLSLQSGDNKVLRDMNRHYTTDVYAEKIALIRKYDENACIATDVIVGFPTETEETHSNTMNFIREVGFSDIHVFPFSAREGTRAYRMPRLDKGTVLRRRNELLELKRELKEKYLKKNIGKEQRVLIEEKICQYYCGYSQYYIKIYTNKDSGIVNCYPNEIFSDGLMEV